jgi:hypothetical protein
LETTGKMLPSLILKGHSLATGSLPFSSAIAALAATEVREDENDDDAPLASSRSALEELVLTVDCDKFSDASDAAA